MFRCEGVKPLVRANHYCGCLFVCLFLIELPDWAIYPCGVIDSVVDQRNIWEASQLISQMSVIFVLFWHTRFPSQSLIGGLTVKDTHTHTRVFWCRMRLVHYISMTLTDTKCDFMTFVSEFCLCDRLLRCHWSALPFVRLVGLVWLLLPVIHNSISGGDKELVIRFF